MVLTSYELRSSDKIPNTRTCVFFLSLPEPSKNTSLFIFILFLIFFLFLRVRRLGCDAVTIVCGVACDGRKLDSEKLFAAWWLTAHLKAGVWWFLDVRLGWGTWG
jgi:hypothetical protein